MGKEYLKDVDEYFDKFNNYINSGNRILDLLLMNKFKMCKEKGINFKYNLTTQNLSRLNALDIISIFGNVIDNAIEACLKIKDSNIDKKIKLRGTLVNRFFVIKCKNTKVNNVNSKNNKLITDKKDLFLHGIGIDSIRSSVKKYNGNVEINLDKNSFTMIIYIPIKGMYTQLGI